MKTAKRTKNQPSTRSKRVKLSKTEIESTIPHEVSDNGTEQPASQEGDEASVQKELSTSLGIIRSTLEEKKEWTRRFTLRLQEEEQQLVQSIKAAKEKINDSHMVFQNAMRSILIDAIAPLENYAGNDKKTQPKSEADSATHVQLPTTTSQFREHTATLVGKSELLTLLYSSISSRKHPIVSSAKTQRTLQADKSVAQKSIRAARSVVNGEIERLLAEQPRHVSNAGLLTAEEEKLGRHLIALGDTSDKTLLKKHRGWGVFVRDLKKATGKMERLCRRENI